LAISRAASCGPNDSQAWNWATAGRERYPTRAPASFSWRRRRHSRGDRSSTVSLAVMRPPLLLPNVLLPRLTVAGILRRGPGPAAETDGGVALPRHRLTHRVTFG